MPYKFKIDDYVRLAGDDTAIWIVEEMNADGSIYRVTHFTGSYIAMEWVKEEEIRPAKTLIN